MKSVIESEILEEGIQLLDTFTITYPYGMYKESYYSTTYDELSKWLRRTISHLKKITDDSTNDSLICYLNSFRGKLGNIDRDEFRQILHQLQDRF
ncbi:hypothetical protein [Proteiniclasticum sp.]|uniref:hypothetical protein n=1 Tax=Proteiniclasticum sp. TaxID=2053595 RepID=UPI00289CB296|nr:hypothetical protein [Proteiniclasticum sp.]